MTQDEIKELAGHRDVPPWVVKLVGDAIAKDREQMIQQEGWRQCAKGQRTTQFCGQLQQAVEAERERFAEECIDLVAFHGGSVDLEAAIRARGNKE